MNLLDLVNYSKVNKSKDGVIEFKYEEYVDFNWFHSYLSRQIILGSRYSILVRTSFSSESTGGYTEYKMLGPQKEINSSTEEELLLRAAEIYKLIGSWLKTSMENYNYNEFDVINIQILVFILGDKPVIRSDKLTSKSLGNQKDLVNMSRVSSSYKQVDLMSGPDDLGRRISKYMVIGELKSLTLLDGSKVSIESFDESAKLLNICNNHTKFYQKDVNDSMYILIVNESEKQVVVYVFTLSGTFVNKIAYERLSNKTYTRKIGNVTVYVGDKGIYKRDIKINLPTVYPYKLTGKTVNMTQPDWRIGTMDLETYRDSNMGKTYAIGFYTKDSVNTFYIGTELNSDSLIMECIDKILVDKYNGYTFYIHNLTNFDVYFLFRVLISYENKYTCIPYFRDDSIIGLKVSTKLGKKNISIRIVDSYNLLKDSLDKLCKAFDTPVKKSYFPYDFVTKNTLYYVGEKPDMRFYNQVDKSKQISNKEYDNIPLDNWDLKNETILYLEKDLISLFNVMEQFINRVHIKYNVHVTKSLTISSLSMDIFLRKYYGNNIPLIKQKSIYTDIKKSYYGGVTEVYKPHGKNLYYYDVNSLYPYSSLNPMPGCDCVYTDNINKYLGELEDLFGFFYCKIKASDKYIGLLPTRSEEGLTMPTGEFEGWYFSEELKFAHENGYEIYVVKGYTFDKVYNVFNSYVRDLYKIKSTTKDPVEKQMVKSLLNNLLGRFGLDINKYITSLVTYDQFRELIQTRKFRSVKFIEDKILLSYEKELNKDICNDHSIDFKEVVDNFKKDSNKFQDEEYHDVSVAISSCVTSYARIYMNKIKLDILRKGGSIYYTDTDSIVTDLKLDDNLVGEDIGEFKLEHKIREGYFISNKTYGIYNELGETIIKNKGIYKGSLTYDKLQSLYLGNEVTAERYETIKSLSKGGAVLFVKKDISLYPNSYNKRVKVYDNNLWVDTKPINRKSFHTSNYRKEYSIGIFDDKIFNMFIYLSGLILPIVILFIIPDCVYSVESMQDITNTFIEDINTDYIGYYENDVVATTENTRNEGIWDYVINNFVNKFNPDLGGHDNSLDSMKHIDMPTVKNNNSDTDIKVLDKVLKHHIDELCEENKILKDQISLKEIELQNNRISKLERKIILESIINDVDNLVSNKSL